MHEQCEQRCASSVMHKKAARDAAQDTAHMHACSNRSRSLFLMLQAAAGQRASCGRSTRKGDGVNRQEQEPRPYLRLQPADALHLLCAAVNHRHDDINRDAGRVRVRARPTRRRRRQSIFCQRNARFGILYLEKKLYLFTYAFGSPCSVRFSAFPEGAGGPLHPRLTEGVHNYVFLLRALLLMHCPNEV